jgi:hypothetical protein
MSVWSNHDYWQREAMGYRPDELTQEIDLEAVAQEYEHACREAADQRAREAAEAAAGPEPVPGDGEYPF